MELKPLKDCTPGQQRLFHAVLQQAWFKAGQLDCTERKQLGDWAYIWFNWGAECNLSRAHWKLFKKVARQLGVKEGR